MTWVAPEKVRRDGNPLPVPPARGPWTGALYALLGCGDQPVTDVESLGHEDVLFDHDFQLALYLCYELHYGGLEGVDDQYEWSPPVLMLRAAMEERFERAVELLVAPAQRREARVGAELQRLVREDDGPSLSRYVEQHATHQQALEFAIHRSAYQLKEADPHSWAIPRLRGAPKAALVEIQFDEYGEGRASQIHAELYADTMRALGLDAVPGAYLERLPGITLATVNLMSWFGLHRRLRGAIVGHLAVFELSSSVPNRRYGNGWRRLGAGEEVTRFYDVHVEADAVHESIAAWDLADTLAVQQPQLADDIVFGGRALLAIEALWADHLLSCWKRGESSLLEPLSTLQE